MSTEKTDLYHSLNQQAAALLDGERDLIANLSNVSALVFMTLEGINWAGFYLLKEGELVLGPFQGKPACVRIPVGKGVCGTAVSSGQTQLIDDVHSFPGHIACDAASESEIVIPIRKDNEIIGVLDIDAPIMSRFDSEDQKGLEILVKTLERSLN